MVLSLFWTRQDCWKWENNADLQSKGKLVAADWSCIHIQTLQHWTLHYLLHHRCRSQSLSGERQHHCRSWQCQPEQLATTTGKQMCINHVGQRPRTGPTFMHVPTSLFSYLLAPKYVPKIRIKPTIYTNMRWEKGGMKGGSTEILNTSILAFDPKVKDTASIWKRKYREQLAPSWLGRNLKNWTFGDSNILCLDQVEQNKKISFSILMTKIFYLYVFFIIFHRKYSYSSQWEEAMGSQFMKSNILEGCVCIYSLMFEQAHWIQWELRQLSSPKMTGDWTSRLAATSKTQ